MTTFVYRSHTHPHICPIFSLSLELFIVVQPIIIIYFNKRDMFPFRFMWKRFKSHKLHLLLLILVFGIISVRSTKQKRNVPIIVMHNKWKLINKCPIKQKVSGDTKIFKMIKFRFCLKWCFDVFSQQFQQFMLW